MRRWWRSNTSLRIQCMCLGSICSFIYIRQEKNWSFWILSDNLSYYNNNYLSIIDFVINFFSFSVAPLRLAWATILSFLKDAMISVWMHSTHTHNSSWQEQQLHGILWGDWSIELPWPYINRRSSVFQFQGNLRFPLIALVTHMQVTRFRTSTRTHHAF